MELMGPWKVGAFLDVLSHEDDGVLLVVLGIAGQRCEARTEEELADVDGAPLALPCELPLDLDEDDLTSWQECGYPAQEVACSTFDVDPPANRFFGGAAEEPIERDTFDSPVLVLRCC